MMQIATEGIDRICPEIEVIDECLDLDGKRIVELGCGRADITRIIATGGTDRQVVALEVDQVQHAINARITDLPNVAFRLAGAEAIPEPDASADVVFMFKSLHHVPRELMGDALDEIARVLRPGGYAYFSEPVYAGEFNEILRLFHDEEQVREAAFAALEHAVASGRFELARELFFLAPVHFNSFAVFESAVIGVSHTQHRLSPGLYEQVRERFSRHLGADGADFLQPVRVDLLRKPR